jgi:hypothetical protein
LNKVINGWTSQHYPEDWQRVRNRWFFLYRIRQAVNITGFISLLAGWVFGMA